MRLGVRRGDVDAEANAITATPKLSPGVKCSVNSSTEMAVGSHIFVGTQCIRGRKGDKEGGREGGKRERRKEGGREGGGREGRREGGWEGRGKR